MGGRGVKRISDVTHPRIQSNQFSFLQYSIFKCPQIFLKINPFWPSKFLKSFLTSYSLADSVAFERSVISSIFILLSQVTDFPSVYHQIQAVLTYIFSVKSLSLFGEWHGGEGGREKRWQSVTWGEGGSKNGHFGVTYFLCVTFWWVTWGEGVERKDDKVWHGGGGGSKMAIFGVTYFLTRPLSNLLTNFPTP